MKFVLIIIMLLVSSVCFADVTCEVIGKSLDTNGSIVVKTAYYIDGKNVESRYPQEGGKYYWVTRYNCINFANMTETQIQERIDKDLKAFGEQLILKPIQEQQRDNLKTANQNFYDSLNIVGHNLTVTEAKMTVDNNFDGVQETELTVTSDGKTTSKPYIAP